MATKNFLEFKKYIRTTSIKGNARIIFEYLFEVHNAKYGYAFPTFQNMMDELKVSSKETVTKAIKTLEKEGLIVVNRELKNNRYYIVGVEKFIVLKPVAKKVVNIVKESVKETVEEVKEVVENVFKPSFDMSKSEVVESEVVEDHIVIEEVVDVPEVEEVSAIDRFKNMIFASMQDDFNNEVREVMQIAESEKVTGGTIKDYEYLVRKYGKREVIKGIVSAVAYAKENGVGYFSKIKTYLEELDKKRSSLVPMW